MAQTNEHDAVFNHQVAKRSVARAALHLGVDSMSEEALDVMGDVLLTYLQRVGGALSQLVESSGRTSAHANVLDTIRAIDVVTSPAVHQVHLQGQEATTPSGEAWKDLAAFTLGNDWLKQKDAASVQPQTGGKVGPSGSTKKDEKGWHAPYLDEIPSFPVASDKCANPHSLDRKEATSLYGIMPTPTHDSQALLEEMPDEAFTTDWGSLKPMANKKKASSDDHEDAPPAKRAKLQDGTAASVREAESTLESKKPDESPRKESEKKLPAKEKDPRPAYVPSFLPPFPTSEPGRSIAIKDNVAPLASSTATSSTGSNVRSSLVNMSSDESGYWGSGWEAAPSVPEGRRPPKSARSAEKKEQAHKRQKVIPLDRASTNRTSRIIEGSMDAA